MATNDVHLSVSENNISVPLTISSSKSLRSATPQNGSPYYVGARAYVEQTEEGAVVTVIDKDGTTTATILNGADGQDGAAGQDGADGTDGADGFSPTATVTKSGDTATISITDINGTTTATVSDGASGTSVFVAEFNVTTYADVKDAYDDDEIIICTADDSGNTMVLQLVYFDATNEIFFFAKPNGDGWYWTELSNADGWDDGTRYFASTDVATQLADGLMSALDKQKLDGLSKRNIWYGTCSTSASQSPKSITTASGDFELTTGSMLCVLFSHTNSLSSVSLQVDGGASKSAYAMDGTSDISNRWGSNEVVSFVYDGTKFIMLEQGLASTTQHGITKLNNTVTSTSTSEAATANAVKTAYDNGGVQSVNGSTGAVTVTVPTITDTYDGTSSNGMSGKAVKSAIDALDGTVSGSAGSGKTLTAFSQTDGKVSATFGNISITKSQISDFPTIPTVNDATLTIQKNGTTVKTFTANASSNVTANITVPTDTGDLTNGAGYITGYTETDPIFLASAAHGISSSDISNWNGKSDFSGSYNDLTDKPTIPSNVSDLVNDSGFITSPNVVYCTCSTASGTAAKVATIESGSLTSLNKGDQAIVKFTNANGKANPTLKIGDTDAKSIMRYGTTAPSTSAASSWNAGSCVLFTYDGTYWQMANYLNTTYSEISQANITNGSGSSTGLVTGRRAKAAVGAFAPVKDVTVDGTSVLSGTTAAIDLSGKADASHTHTKSEITDFPAIHNVPSGGSSGQVLSKASGTDYDLAWVNQSGGGGGITDVEVDGTSVVTGGVAEIDLTGKSDIGHTHTTSAITDFPSLATVATSGSYNDLTDKPTIPTVNNATLTIQKNGTTVNTFTANASSNVTANITVPTVTDTYSGTSSDGMSGKAVKSAIDALDGTISGSAGTGKTLTAFSQTDGKVSATFGNISITKSQVSDFPTIPTITDTYSGTSQDGMSGIAVKSAIDALDGTVSGTAGAGKTLTAFSQTDGKVSATFGSISITKSQVSDFPSLATVATSGDYGDLLNKPTFSGSTASKTPTEVKTAIDSGNFIDITHFDPVYGLIQVTNFNYSAGASIIVANVVFYYSLVGLMCFALIGNLHDDTWTTHVYVLAQTSDIPTLATVATSGEYDDLTKKPTVVQAQGSGNIAVTTSTIAQIPLVTSTALYNNTYDAEVNQTLGGIKIKTAGIYRVQGSIYMTASGNSTRFGVYLYKSANSGNYASGVEFYGGLAMAANSTLVVCSPAILVSCAENDMIYIGGRTQGAGASISGDNHSTFINVERVG